MPPRVRVEVGGAQSAAEAIPVVASSARVDERAVVTAAAEPVEVPLLVIALLPFVAHDFRLLSG
jgi:hypothetical protein